jgi:diacylglycerol kinase family enzyme
MSAVILLNPQAGRSQARLRLQALLRSLPPGWEVWSTESAGHAEELAYRAASSGRELVVAAGGDGTVHEAANGILRANVATVRLGILPIGSANDYFASLPSGEAATLAVDVGRVREPAGKERYFLCCLGLGFNGAVTLEARRISRLQGIALYGLAALKALYRHFRCPEMTLSLDDEPPRTEPTLMLSLLIGKREGRFPLAPQAEVDDGLFDYIHAGKLSRLQVLRLLPRLALFGPPRSYPHVRQGRCRQLRLRSAEPLIVHGDGEFFCRPEDQVQELAVDILPRRLLIQRTLHWLK